MRRVSAASLIGIALLLLLGREDANEKGVADADVTIEKGSLQGRFSVLGRAIIVHEKGNDESKPPIGATESRLACGVIGITSNS